MSVTSTERSKTSPAQEIVEDDQPEIDPASRRRGPVTPEREPSDGELLARVE